MDISQIKKAKLELESRIRKLVSDFETETRVAVKDVNVERLAVGTSNDPHATMITSVRVGIEVE